MALAAAVLLAIPTIWLLSHLLLRPPRAAQPLVIGHRCAAGLAPENTLAAARLALALGVEMVEVDVQRTIDGVLFLMHDDKLNRTTNGNGHVSGKTWEDISKLDAGIRFGSDFAGEPVPSLDQLLSLTAGRPIHLYLEAKDPSRFPGIADQLANAAREAKHPEQILVGSFDREWLREFHRSAPDTPLILITESVWGISPQSGVAWISADWKGILMDPTAIRRFHNRGWKVAVWTVDEEWLMRLLVWLGVDALVTNRPDRAKRLP